MARVHGTRGSRGSGVRAHEAAAAGDQRSRSLCRRPPDSQRGISTSLSRVMATLVASLGKEAERPLLDKEYAAFKGRTVAWLQAFESVFAQKKEQSLGSVVRGMQLLEEGVILTTRMRESILSAVHGRRELSRRQVLFLCRTICLIQWIRVRVSFVMRQENEDEGLSK